MKIVLRTVFCTSSDSRYVCSNCVVRQQRTGPPCTLQKDRVTPNVSLLLLGTRTTGAQEELHGKIDKLYEDTSGWKTRLDHSTKLVDERYGDAD